MFDKLLVANRGEIAVRIIRAAKELGLRTVAVFSEADKDSLAVQFADEAICIGPPPATKSYLNAEAIIAAARQTGAGAIHPGYGFLSENAQFAAAVAAAGLVFVGPTPETIRTMGDKAAARTAARSAGVPTVPGSEGEVTDLAHALQVALDIGYPSCSRRAPAAAAAAFASRSMKRACRSTFDVAQAEAAGGLRQRPDVYLERFFLKLARHIEVQVFGDGHGILPALGRARLQLQRRHQKIW